MSSSSIAASLWELGNPYFPNIPGDICTEGTAAHRAILAARCGLIVHAVTVAGVTNNAGYSQAAVDLLLQKGWIAVPGVQLSVHHEESKLVVRMLVAAVRQYVEDVASSVAVSYKLGELSPAQQNVYARKQLSEYAWLNDDTSGIYDIPFASAAMARALRRCYAYTDEKTRIDSINRTVILLTATGLKNGLERLIFDQCPADLNGLEAYREDIKCIERYYSTLYNQIDFVGLEDSMISLVKARTTEDQNFTGVSRMGADAIFRRLAEVNSKFPNQKRMEKRKLARRVMRASKLKGGQMDRVRCRQRRRDAD